MLDRSSSSIIGLRAAGNLAKTQTNNSVANKPKRTLRSWGQIVDIRFQNFSSPCRDLSVEFSERVGIIIFFPTKNEKLLCAQKSRLINKYLFFFFLPCLLKQVLFQDLLVALGASRTCDCVCDDMLLGLL